MGNDEVAFPQISCPRIFMLFIDIGPKANPWQRLAVKQITKKLDSCFTVSKQEAGKLNQPFRNIWFFANLWSVVNIILVINRHFARGRMKESNHCQPNSDRFSHVSWQRLTELSRRLVTTIFFEESKMAHYYFFCLFYFRFSIVIGSRRRTGP